MRITTGLIGLLALLALTGALVAADPPAKAEKPRNPFGVPDLPDPDGQDVQDFAGTVQLAGDGQDANAAQWVKEATAGKKGSLEGEWFERWNAGGGAWQDGKGPAQIKVDGDRVYILVDASNGKFLIDLKRQQNRLIGRYRAIDNPADTGPCVFLIVDDERIDGNWRGSGRWDFRRKLK